MSLVKNQSFHRPAAPGIRPVATSGYCNVTLLKVIESQVIPRLLASHPRDKAHATPATATAFAPSAQELDAFAQLCTLDSVSGLHQYIDLLEQKQVPNDDIFMHLIAPAARQLGALWEQDLVDFSQVTLGLMRLQQITHRLGYAYQSGPQRAGPVRRLMIAAAPGSQHMLGLVMVSELFRKAGWQVVVEIANTEEGLCQAARNEWFDLIGLSVGLTGQLPGLPGLIAKLKAASPKPQLPVMVGGAAFSSLRLRAQELGADGISTDAKEAVRLGEALVSPT